MSYHYSNLSHTFILTNTRENPFEENERLFSSVCAPSHIHESLKRAEKLGTELAEQLLADGAEKILSEARNLSKTSEDIK